MPKHDPTALLPPVVITADIVNSTRFPPEVIGAWLTEALTTLQSFPGTWLLPPEVYRGDSFQGVLAGPEQALRIAVLARALLRSKSVETDLRIAIGIGRIHHLTDRPGTSDGEAFRLSGQLADTLRQQRARIGIALPHPAAALQDVLNLLEAVIENWTSAQSEVIAGLLTGETINLIARRLAISQSAASQRAAAARWWALEPILVTFPQLLTPYFGHD